MRVQLLQAVALVSVTLIPVVGEASSIIGTSAIPDNTTAEHAVETEQSSEEPSPWAGPSLTSLFDESGDQLLLLSPAIAFDRFGEQGKLRSWLDYESCSGSCSGSGGSGSGGSGPLGGLNLAPLGLNLDPESILDPDLNLDLNLDLGLDLTLPLDQCCDCNECGGGAGQTVPEPATLLLALPGVALGVQRAARTRRANERR